MRLHLVADVLLRGGRRPVSQGLYASSLMWHSASTSYLMPTGACASSCFLEAASGSIHCLQCHQHSTVANIIFVLSQVIAQLELWNERTSGRYEHKVYVLPKHLDEKVAALHLPKLGAKLTKLTADQAKYINVPVTGPFKPAHYRY